MGTAGNNYSVTEFPLLNRFWKPKNDAPSDDSDHTFEILANLHKLLPNNLMETLHSYKSEEDQKICKDPELSGLERVLARHDFPAEINLTPKPSRMVTQKRTATNILSDRYKCPQWKRSTKDPPMATIVVSWLKHNVKATEDFKSVIYRLSAFGTIQSVTMCGKQTAIVAFKDIISACHAVRAFRSRTPGTMIQCSWQQKFLRKD
uniref:RRM domain-containing protein n=2 Tax=Otolemur garnettii TaxID=30611 RepID=H0X573_OTOGA